MKLKAGRPPPGLIWGMKLDQLRGVAGIVEPLALYAPLAWLISIVTLLAEAVMSGPRSGVRLGIEPSTATQKRLSVAPLMGGSGPGMIAASPRLTPVALSP